MLFVLAMSPGTALAQTAEDDDSAVIRVNSDTVIGPGESVENLVVISANARIEGTVTGTLVVIDGDATIAGTVEEDLTVISGDIELLDGSTVKDVHSIRGEITRAPGATVTGDVDENDFSGLSTALGVISILLWVGITIALLVAGIVFALVGGRQLTAATKVMTGEAAYAILGAVFVWIGLPVLAVIAFITVIGAPLGLGILLFLLPVLGFLGYLVAATRLGSWLTGAMNRPATERPVLAVVLGVLILQVLLLIPVLGAVIALLASIWGAGALACVAYRGARGREVAPEPAPPVATL
jgi:cytoskeletal protein CcmA (bactofilin family)